VRVNVQLIEAATNRNLWAESYERKLSDVLALQNEVALAIAREIQVKLSPQEEARFAGVRAIDPQAHQAYLLGRYELARLTSEGTQRAIGHFERAIGIDPNHAPAYAALAEAYYYLSNWYLPPDQAMPLVRANAVKALERDGDLSIAHTMLAVVKAQYDFEWAEAMTTLQRAIRLNPGDATAHHWFGYVLMELGHFEEAEREFQKAAELDPMTIGTQWHATWPSFYRGDYPRTVSSLKELLAKDASAWSTYSLLGETYEQMGDYDEAIVELRKALALGGNPWVLAAIGRTHAKAGRRDSAMAVLRQLEHLAQGTYVSPYGAASIHAALGDADRAFELLERALSQHSEDIVLIKIDPRLEPLRTDRRFADLVRRIGLADSSMGSRARRERHAAARGTFRKTRVPVCA
jgi:tetratricopeptide (TPR) repeat protein